MTYKLTSDKKSFKFYWKFLFLDPFKDSHFNSPHHQSSKTGSFRLIKGYTDEKFCKVI